MATSGTFADQLNNLSVISSALRKINRLGDFETLADTDIRYTASLPVLKSIVKAFATKGMPLWAIDELSIPMSNFTTAAGVTIGTSGATITNVAPLKVIQAVRRDVTNSIDIPMEVYTADQYNSIPQKSVTGTPNFFTYYPNNSSVVYPVKSTLKVWPLPDTYWSTNGAVYIRYQAPFEDVGTSTQDLDFPAEWQRAVIYTLACDLAADYGVDMNSRNLLEKKRAEVMDETLGFGTEEGSFFIQPRKH